MFSGKRKKATKHTIEAIRPLIAIYQQNYGISPHFWDDEFVLGFVHFLISFHASVTSGHNLSTEDKGMLLFEVLTTLSNLDGKNIGNRITELVSQEPKSEAFELGADNAAICAFYSIDKLKDKNHPTVEKAKAMAEANGQSNDRGVIGGFLMFLLFYEPTQDRSK